MIATVLAAALLLPCGAGEAEASYEALVARGVALGREGRLAEAEEALDRALALSPERPEALVERGGLRFLEARYDDAVRDLARALALREDAYTRRILGASLHLAGRSDEALACWNRIGEPILRYISIEGLEHTRDRVARRELSLAEGAPLERDRVRASRLRLHELDLFSRVTLRPVPKGDGKADLDVALAERHGLYGSPIELVTTTAVNAVGQRFRLRYSGFRGTGVSFGGQYRWQANRQETSLFLHWPRPLGLPAYLRLSGFRGRQAFDLDGPLVRRSTGLDLSLRRVIGPGTVLQLAFSTRDRRFSRADPLAPPGRVNGLEAGIEQRLLEAHRHRLDASLRVFRAAAGLGSDVAYHREAFRLGYVAFLAKPEDKAIERSVAAAQVRWGRGSDGMPLDEMYAPGGEYEMALPLRAHHQLRDGVIGVETPMGRTLLLGNLEWRRRLVARGAAQVGFVLFLDSARLDRIAGEPWVATDLGLGLRLAVAGSPILRVDYGHGLSDGKNALFLGLGAAF